MRFLGAHFPVVPALPHRIVIYRLPQSPAETPSCDITQTVFPLHHLLTQLIVMGFDLNTAFITEEGSH